MNINAYSHNFFDLRRGDTAALLQGNNIIDIINFIVEASVDKVNYYIEEIVVSATESIFNQWTNAGKTDLISITAVVFSDNAISSIIHEDIIALTTREIKVIRAAGKFVSISSNVYSSIVPDLVLVDLSNNYILDSISNYIKTTEV